MKINNKESFQRSGYVFRSFTSTPRLMIYRFILALINAGGASGSKVLPCSPRPPPLHGSQISDYPIIAAYRTLYRTSLARLELTGKKVQILFGGC
ncbi:hypothetical protein Q7C36_013253 [Tachysurus vachellii]|uniref:Uncharacterized protein n=1 Tax=Tachysurus vachellii TaxID=175792 RepID=A0AA88SGM0_TACVA|nr:hypothetical protein Q7C36_013253 [Tachysurus vachellii]